MKRTILILLALSALIMPVAADDDSTLSIGFTYAGAYVFESNTALYHAPAVSLTGVSYFDDSPLVFFADAAFGFPLDVAGTSRNHFDFLMSVDLLIGVGTSFRVSNALEIILGGGFYNLYIGLDGAAWANYYALGAGLLLSLDYYFTDSFFISLGARPTFTFMNYFDTGYYWSPFVYFDSGFEMALGGSARVSAGFRL